MSDVGVMKFLPLFQSFCEPQNFFSLSDTTAKFETLDDTAGLSRELFPPTLVSYSNLQQLSLLAELNVKRIKLSSYFSRIFLPNVQNLCLKNYGAVFHDLLFMIASLPMLADEDKDFVNLLKQTAFLPSNDDISAGDLVRLHRPADLYDPEEEELKQLLGDSFFPYDSFQREDVLVFLRSLGLRSSLDWEGIVSCALSIEQGVLGNPMAQQLRGESLLKFMDKHASRLFAAEAPKNDSDNSSGRRKSTGGFSLKSLLFGGKSANETNIAEPVPSSTKLPAAYIHELCGISWIPVLTDSPDPCLPWQAAYTTVVASPRESRPSTDAWLCSASLRLCRCQIFSKHLLYAFGWTAAIEFSVIAVQLRELAALYELVKKADHGLSNTAYQDLRERVTALIPILYQSLNAAAVQKKDELRFHLRDSAWVWVGDTFVRPSRVAFSSPINAAPYLYLVPQDLAVFRNLLSVFDVRMTFGALDYVEVLQQMAEESGVVVGKGDSADIGVPLPDVKLDVAISLIALLSSDGSGIESLNALNLTLYLPDNTNRLASSLALVLDDVPWLAGPEYSSVRAGIRFLHPNVAAKFASKMGVKSLRMLLVDRNAEQMFNVTESTIEAFGQVLPEISLDECRLY